MVKDVKIKLDGKVIRVCGYGIDIYMIDKEFKLIFVEFVFLWSGNVIVQSDFVIVVFLELIYKLGVEFVKSKIIFIFGIVMLDEFY